MTRETVIAPDMQKALRLVKRRFGEDALILGTRSRHRRREGSMALIEEVEVEVALESQAQGASGAGMSSSAKGLRDGVAGKPRLLEAELHRVEALLDEMEVGLELRGSAPPSAGGYPLAQALSEMGVSHEALQRLTADHAEEVPPANQADPEAAIERLGQVLGCVESMQLSDLRGHHVMMGPPGVGKTTLVHKLAGRVAASGARVVVLTCVPPHPGENIRLERAATELGFEAALAADYEAFFGALRYLVDRDLVIVDMPPLDETQWELLAEAEKLLNGEPLLKHLVLAADGGWREKATALSRCDFLALTRVDLASPLIPCLDLAGSIEFFLSFLSAGSALDEGLDLAQSESLLLPLRRIFNKAEGAEAGART